MKKRIADKILKATVDYQQCRRWDMPYNGAQIYKAAKRLLPTKWRPRYKNWRKESKAEGLANFGRQLANTTL